MVALFLASSQPLSASVMAEANSSVEVSKTIDATINVTDIVFGALQSGSSNSSSLENPVNITINANTNVPVSIQVNGSDLITYGGVIGVRNLTYCNESMGEKTELNSTFSSGSNLIGLPFSDWVSIPNSPVDVYRQAFFWVSVPSDQKAGAYSGKIYLRVVESS